MPVAERGRPKDAPEILEQTAAEYRRRAASGAGTRRLSRELERAADMLEAISRVFRSRGVTSVVAHNYDLPRAHLMD